MLMRRLAGLGGVTSSSISTTTTTAASSAATAISRHVFKLLNDQGNREWEASLAYAAAGIWFTRNELPGSAAWCQTHSEEERGHALKIFDHLASRRIEEGEGEGKGPGGYASVLAAKVMEGVGGGGTGYAGEADAVGGAKQQERRPAEKELATEEPPQAAGTFEWDATPNVLFDVKGPFPTRFPDPVAVWRSMLVQERANSRRYFELMQAARASSDFVTEQLVMSFYIPEQLAEEKAVEEIYDHALLVTKRGPGLYFELDRDMPSKPH